jgi:methylase of polypeptide subunit release factors
MNEPSASTVLDCACGLGTQAIGLARRGCTVHATDLSPAAIARAARDAESFGAALVLLREGEGVYHTTYTEYVDKEQ